MTAQDILNENEGGQYLRIGEQNYSFQEEFYGEKGEKDRWGGLWECETGEEFVRNAARLYTERDLWV